MGQICGEIRFQQDFDGNLSIFHPLPPNRFEKLHLCMCMSVLCLVPRCPQSTPVMGRMSVCASPVYPCHGRRGSWVDGGVVGWRRGDSVVPVTAPGQLGPPLSRPGSCHALTESVSSEWRPEPVSRIGVESGSRSRSRNQWDTKSPRNEDISETCHVLKFCIFQHFPNKLAEIRGETKFGGMWDWVPMNPSPPPNKTWWRRPWSVSGLLPCPAVPALLPCPAVPAQLLLSQTGRHACPSVHQPPDNELSARLGGASDFLSTLPSERSRLTTASDIHVLSAHLQRCTTPIIARPPGEAVTYCLTKLSCAATVTESSEGLPAPIRCTVSDFMSSLN